MTRGFNEFLRGLRVKDGETSQVEVAEEAIKKQLFDILFELDMENGQEIEIDKVVQLISEKLGIQDNKNRIVQIITKVFEKGNSNYQINENGKIKAVFNRTYILQKEREKQLHQEAEVILKSFVPQVEMYVSYLEQQKISVNGINLRNQFSEEEREKNPIWIDLAIDRVLNKREQDIIK